MDPRLVFQTLKWDGAAPWFRAGQWLPFSGRAPHAVPRMPCRGGPPTSRTRPTGKALPTSLRRPWSNLRISVLGAQKLLPSQRLHLLSSCLHTLLWLPPFSRDTPPPPPSSLHNPAFFFFLLSSCHLLTSFIHLSFGMGPSVPHWDLSSWKSCCLVILFSSCSLYLQTGPETE